MVSKNYFINDIAITVVLTHFVYENEFIRIDGPSRKSALSPKEYSFISYVMRFYRRTDIKNNEQIYRLVYYRIHVAEVDCDGLLFFYCPYF